MTTPEQLQRQVDAAVNRELARRRRQRARTVLHVFMAAHYLSWEPMYRGCPR